MVLKAHEHPLKKIFSSDFDFEIPHYQRPYAWGVDQSLQLLDDLKDALDRKTDEPYFLGSVVLVRPNEEAPQAYVIDGQQRLTTLSILFAVLRDLSPDEDSRSALRKMVLEPGVPLDGIASKPRLRLREQDADFFADYVQQPGQLSLLMQLTNQALASDSQASIRDNTKALHGALAQWTDAQRFALAALARNRTFLVVVSTPDIPSAHRIFSVMNARGLDLTPSDIFKSDVIGKVDAAHQEAYAKKWETAEQNLGRSNFADLFLHLRMIEAKVRGQRELLLEFPEQVLAPYLATSTTAAFVDEMLLPYSTAYAHLLQQDYDDSDAHWVKVNMWLRRLIQLDNNDWRPPALWALRSFPDDPAFLDGYLRKLERLAASMLVRRIYATPRVQRYADLLRQVTRLGASAADADAFALTPEERAETQKRLAGEIYLVQPVRKYVLLRLDEQLANSPGVTYAHKVITVEHVLPQKPATDSHWLDDFTEDEREHWTHRLGNLVLLNRNKNSEAQNYDFDKKKQKYFQTSTGVPMFALTVKVMNEQAWTPLVVEQRHNELLAMLGSIWELGGD